ncbi:hypothetical protein TELCIR_20073, partial [Teladorsagia circumcincta]
IRPFDRSNFPPKPSVPRRITVATRPPIPVRRPGFAEGALIQSQSPQVSRVDSLGSRIAAGSDQIAQRQFPVPPSRRFQQPHRFLQKEVLIEDRRTPPRTQNQQVYEPGASRLPSQTRPFISSYRRQPQAVIRQPGVQYVREGTSYQEASRSHSALPPPPDPPLLPYSQGYVRPIPLERGSPPPAENESRAGSRNDIASSGDPSPRGAGVLYPRDGQPIEESVPGQDDHILTPPPPPPILRPRFPSILRKTDGAPIPPGSAIPQQQNPPSMAQRPPPPPPRPPPASRPLPPHRLLNMAPRPVPPHRLIKSLPLPVVPAPRAPKPTTNTDTTNAPEQSQGAAAVERPASSSTAAQSSLDKALIEKANALSSADLDPLRILADVSEAARDSVASSNAAMSSAAPSAPSQQSAPAQQSAPQSSANVASNGDDDDDFEEEL